MAVISPAPGFKARTFVSSGFSADGTYISASAGRKDIIKLAGTLSPDRMISMRREKTEEGCIVPLKMRRTPSPCGCLGKSDDIFFSGEESMWLGEWVNIRFYLQIQIDHIPFAEMFLQ